jgi:hypothetical protein
LSWLVEAHITAPNVSTDQKPTVFGILYTILIPEFRKIAESTVGKLMKIIEKMNGPSIAIIGLPVMYRLLESIQASPMNSRIRQEIPPTKRPLKRGNRPEDPVEGAVDITTVLICLGGQ